MAVTQEHADQCGTCPRCQHHFPLEVWARNAQGHLSDGLMWVCCPNCQQELTLEVTLKFDEVVS